MSNGGGVIKNFRDFDGEHKFLMEELLQPMTNKVDPGRTTMWCSHVSQAVVLDRPEIPRVFSRFENAFGSYTTAVRTLPRNATVMSVFEKNPLQKVYALKYDDGKLDIHFAAPVRHLTENYGYRLKSGIEGASKGDVLSAGRVIQGWPCTDESGNFRYGVNMKTVYMNLEGLTYEDGIVCSESAAERLSHTSIEKITVVLNANDLTVNLYGRPDDHRGFPDVGQEIRNGVLLARRRINHESILFDLSASQLAKVNWEGDTVLYSDGTVVDVDMFSNLSEAELDKHPFNSQILAYHRKWLAFREWFFENFPDVEEEGSSYTDDVAFWYRMCRDTEAAKWRHDRGEFDGVVIRFTVARSNRLTVGSKITNRYGGKGVISQIRPDADMPTTVDGKRAELVVNSLGVINRLNIAQLMESELNFIADKVAEQMSKMTVEDAAEHMLKFYRIVSPEMAKWIEPAFSLDGKENGREKLLGMVREIQSGAEPIRIHQPPFFGTVSPEGLDAAYTAFGVEKDKFVGIEDPLVLGTNYYIKLRHEPESKHSARSAKHLSISGVPTKNSRGVRTSTEHHSTTPIRLGEQELENLLVANCPDELKRMLRLYATDDVSREGAIAELLTRTDSFSSERLEPRGSGMTRPVAGLRALLESIGLKLESEPVETQEAGAVSQETSQEADTTVNQEMTEEPEQTT